MSNPILERYPALGFTLYRRYWFASFASVGATQIITLGQGWLIFELSGSALQLGVLGAAAAVPNILMTLIGGVIADRFDKRIILMGTSLTITLLLAALAWLDFSGTVQVWHVLTVAALVSLVSGLDWPTRVSIYTHLIDRSAFMSAVALNSFIWQSTRMAMPALGGVIILYWDTWTLFALGACGFFVMFLVMSGIHVKVVETTHASPLQQIHEGLSFIWSTFLFRWLMALTFVGMFFSTSVSQIMPVFADMLGAGETGFGYLLSAGGVGSVLGTLLVGGMEKMEKLGAVMLGGAAMAIVAMVLFALTAHVGWYLPTLALAFVTALFGSVYMVTSMTIMQLSVPDRMRGRVMGIHTIGFSLIPLGGLFLGTLAESTGASISVIVGNGLYFAFLLFIVGQRSIRRLDGRRLAEVPVS